MVLALLLVMLVQEGCATSSCLMKANEDVMECKEDLKDRLDDDISDRKECCAFVKFRHCVKKAIEDECDDNEEQAHQEYEAWRNQSEAEHRQLTFRCRDDSHDSFECTFLNHMGVWITLFTFLLILTCIALFACFWTILKTSGTTKSMFNVN